MALVFGVVLHRPLFTGSLPMLFGLTLAVTIPLAYALHRFTGPGRNINWNNDKSAPTCPTGTATAGVELRAFARVD
jgi:hypothetical protein